MATPRHQFILGLIVRKMREDGFTVTMVDGSYGGLLGDKMPLPYSVIRHRPDVIGMAVNGKISIGEAKTENDISSARTWEQLQDYSSVELNNQKCAVYIGVPKSAEDAFRLKLKSLGLLHAENIVVLYIPNEVINA